MGRVAHALVAAVVGVVVGVVVGASPASAASGFTYSVDAVFSPAPGQLRLYGWAYDSDSQAPPIGIHVYVGGGAGDPSAVGYALVANLPRPDAHPYPHGFDFTLDVPLHGPRPVYIYAINEPESPGGNELIWQGTVDIANPAPDTVITSGPPGTGTNPTVTFAFASNEAASGYRCRLDGGVWQPCPSPFTTTVAWGAHSLDVYAVDVEGTSDPTPASATFTVTQPPADPSAPPPPTAGIPPTPGPAAISLALDAVRKKSRLRVDIGPDLDPSNYRFNVQRRTSGTWRTIRRTQTLGANDVMILDLPRGRYRVVVPRQHGMTGTSAIARLRR